MNSLNLHIKHLFRCFLIFIILFLPETALAQTSGLLKTADVQKIMKDILNQHLGQEKMSGEILKKSYQLYIDQFDPERIYLFQSEVDGLLDTHNGELDRELKDYTAGRFTKFEEIDRVIQNAILRARNYRKEILAKPEVLFQSSKDEPDELDVFKNGKKLPFANTVPELKNRIKDEIIVFIGRERQRFGDKAVMENQKGTLNGLLDLLTRKENQYLYVDDQGRQLPLPEKENLFVMHILKALSKSLDSHTSFLDKNEALDLKIRLEKGFKGVGVVLEQKPGGVVISRMIKGGPAQKSGKVVIGDRIVQINGKSAEGNTLEELANQLRDPERKDVDLVLKRKAGGSDEEVKVTLPREFMEVDEGRVKTKSIPFDGGMIGILSMDAFYKGENGVSSENDMRKAIDDLKKKGQLKGLIIDLRENGGGFLNQAVKVAGLFISNGVVVVSKYHNGTKHYYRDMDSNVSFDGPLIILTSKATASAAEIVAQSLQDYGVAVIVGDEQTYGKGTVQSQTVTQGGDVTHFKVTIGEYYTVSGKTPQISGVKADVVVPSYFSNEQIGEEYLEDPMRPGTIQPSYQDSLADVNQLLKPWYLHYYMPTLQKQKTEWQTLIPVLREKSQKRLAGNQTYQNLIEGKSPYKSLLRAEEGFSDKNDYQMREAEAIMKDMITLNQSYFESKVADH